MKLFHCILSAGICILSLIGASCRQQADNEQVCTSLPSEDTEAKQNLQGIWIDKETGTVAFYAKGDTIYYPDTTVVPVYFYIAEDSLYLGNDEVKAYPVDRMGEYVFKFHSVMGEVVTLERSSDPNDTVYFTHKEAVPLTYTEVTKKDTVVYYGTERYHCYIYVNPSSLKVYKTTYTDEGIAVDNVYYDNVIHISVYQGKTCLFSRDYNRKSFSGMVPDGFLEQAILSNVVYDKIDEQGFHFNATVCIPDDASCYIVRICVDREGDVQMDLIEY